MSYATDSSAVWGYWLLRMMIMAAVVGHAVAAAGCTSEAEIERRQRVDKDTATIYVKP